jgi:hypothetical protein
MVISPREFLDQLPDRVGDHTAKIAGMYVPVGAASAQFEGCHAAHTVLQLGTAMVMNVSICGDHQVCIQQVSMFLNKTGDMRAADLLFSFQQHEHVAGECAMDCQVRFDGQNLGEVLALIVANAASVDSPITDGRFEGG